MDMSKKWMTAIGASLLVTAALIIVGIGAYRAGERDGTDVEVVGEVIREGELAGRTVVVDADRWDGHWGFFPGFFVFPLVVIGLVLLFAQRRRSWCGPRHYSDDRLADWHRRAHEESPPTPPPADSSA